MHKHILSFIFFDPDLKLIFFLRKEVLRLLQVYQLSKRKCFTDGAFSDQNIKFCQIFELKIKKKT